MKKLMSRVPSKNYWKELDKLDKAVFALGETTTPELVRGNTLINVRGAWGGRDGDSLSVAWFGKRTECGSRLMGQLVVSEEVESMVGSSNGDLVTIYKYSTIVRLLSRSHHIIPAQIDNLSDYILLDENLGIENSVNDVVGVDSYDLLMDEMRRGASGDYALPFPSPL